MVSHGVTDTDLVQTHVLDGTPVSLSAGLFTMAQTKCFDVVLWLQQLCDLVC